MFSSFSENICELEWCQSKAPTERRERGVLSLPLPRLRQFSPVRPSSLAASPRPSPARAPAHHAVCGPISTRVCYVGIRGWRGTIVGLRRAKPTQRKLRCRSSCSWINHTTYHADALLRAQTRYGKENANAWWFFIGRLNETLTLFKTQRRRFCFPVRLRESAVMFYPFQDWTKHYRIQNNKNVHNFAFYASQRRHWKPAKIMWLRGEERRGDWEESRGEDLGDDTCLDAKMWNFLSCSRQRTLKTSRIWEVYGYIGNVWITISPAKPMSLLPACSLISASAVSVVLNIPMMHCSLNGNMASLLVSLSVTLEW